MTIPPRLRRALFVSLVAVAVAPAAQAVSSGATLHWSQLQWQVDDLAADDGIAAGLTFASLTNSVAWNCLGACDTVGSSQDISTHWSAPVAGAGYQGAATFGADNVSSQITGAVDADERFVFAQRSASFSVAGAARVTLTLPFTLTLDDTGGDDLHGSFAISSLWLDSEYSDFFISSPWDGQTTRHGLLTVTSTYADGATGLLSGWAGSSLQFAPALPPVAAPVPEPAAMLMGLAGLGLVGAAARRRRG